MGKDVELSQSRAPEHAMGFWEDAEPQKQHIDSGEARLQALGYRQEMRRIFGAFTSFACSLVLMANSSGITGGG